MSNPGPDAGVAVPDFDPAPLAALRQMSAAACRRAVELYLADVPRSVAALRQAIRGQDGAAMAQTAHRLKSSSAALGALRIAELCRALERDGKAGQMAGAGPMVDALEGSFVAAGAALAASA